jgi:two-component system sensor histidine kinase KdpD
MAMKAGQSLENTPGRALVLGASLFVVGMVANLAFTIAALSGRASEATVLDVAGRQRMLVQRYLAEVQLSSRAGTGQLRRTPDAADTLEQLRQSANALRYGGRVVLDEVEGTFAVLPEADQVATGPLEEQLEALSALGQAAGQLTRSPQPQDADHVRLVQAGAAFYGSARRTVHAFREHFDRKLQTLLHVEIAFLLVVVLLGLTLLVHAVRAHRALARGMAEKDALKSNLISSLSHDLRTPLAAITAAASSLRSESLTPEVREGLWTDVELELGYLQRLVDNLLDMSRIEAGMVSRHRQPVPIEEVLEGAVRRVEASAAALPLKLEMDPKLPPLLADAVEIQQVLTNLLDNAVKYSTPGTPIRLTAREAGGFAEVTVTNQGVGVPSRELPRVFERFERAQGPKPATRGTGLGLAICKGIVDAHGGQIRMESRPMGETAVVFTLPLARPEGAPLPETASEGAAP